MASELSLALMRRARFVFRWAALLATASLAVACQPEDLPESSYFDEQVEPIFATSCVRQNTGCHLASPQGTATGNLDLSSFDALARRDDVLDAYGPYPLPLLLLKAGDPVEISVETFDPPDASRPDERFVRVTTDIRHAGGSTVDLGTSGFALLQRWTRDGHLRTGVPDDEVRVSEGACVPRAGAAHGYDPSAPHTDAASYDRFRAEVMPVLRDTCAGSSCHGSQIADFYLGCGESEAEVHWNYWVTLQYVTSPASTSEALRRPLSMRRGGVYHEGGTVFTSVDDPRYETLRSWIEDVATRRADLLAPVVPPDADDAGYRFFANRVQPTLVRRGCMFLNCHSPSMFHDLRLRGGSGGHFGRLATVENYFMSRELLAIDSPDPNESRIIAKNLIPPELEGRDGIFHRGGSLFEDFGNDGTRPNLADASDCVGVDADAGDLNVIPSYCVMARWHQIERDAAIARGEIIPEVVRSVVWITRPVGVGRADDFDTYRPGADLLMADATVAADGSLSLGPERSLLGGCGLSAASADLRGPAVSWDGERIAFAARDSASTPLRLYWMQEDGSGCERIPGIAASSDSAAGILIHDFDPAFAPDGRLVFASTRGNLTADATGRAGPTRAPATMRPQANLYILDAGGGVRQLTYLLNQEMQPSFMTDGRLIFTGEKRELDFHQLAGRRMNLDGGDYHPLFAQRESVGFRSATEIAEMLDRNLVIVAAPLDAADGAGTIVIINRSIGPDQDDRPAGDRFFIGSMRFPAPGAFAGGTGAFRSPYPLPTGRMLVSCDQRATSLTAGNFDFDLCEMDPNTGELRVLTGRAGAAEVEAVAVYARADRTVFVSRQDEANGRTFVVPGVREAEILVNDLPMLGTLLFANRRTTRPIDYRIGGFDVLESHAPPEGSTSFDDVGGMVVGDAFGRFFQDQRSLGHVDLQADGSARFRIRGGAPISLRLTDVDGAPLSFGEGALFTGEMVQREQMQFYPGEMANQSLPRGFFNALCGGCHGSISGRELDIAVDVDILTRASPAIDARDASPVDLTGM